MHQSRDRLFNDFYISDQMKLESHNMKSSASFKSIMTDQIKTESHLRKSNASFSSRMTDKMTFTSANNVDSTSDDDDEDY